MTKVGASLTLAIAAAFCLRAPRRPKPTNTLSSVAYVPLIYSLEILSCWISAVREGCASCPVQSPS